jgi:hypothetical protein
MKHFFLALFVGACPFVVFAQSSKTPVPPHANAPASQEIETETIGEPGKAPAVPSAQTGAAGHLEPDQVKALMHKVWLAQYHLTDLLSQVSPDKWKMPPAARQSFGQSMDSLHKAMAAEEEWRSQFDARPDSMYLGFRVYVAINAVLPRVDGVARSVTRYENASYGGQFSQAANQLFDLQQMIEPHLEYLLKNQDNVLLVAQTNLASCQNELNTAEGGKQGRAIPMKNIAPDFKGRKRTAAAAAAAAAAKQEPAKDAPTSKPATNSPSNSQKK